jgi:phosphate transport system substrate-binding protein
LFTFSYFFVEFGYKSMVKTMDRFKIARMRLIALTATPLLVSTAIATIHHAPLRAQSASPTSFALPESLPKDTTVKVDGSSSMSQINAALQKRFQEKFAGSNINLASGGTDEALKALIKGEVDLAAVGRSLTDAEKKEGLVAVPLSREKIAIIVGPENPFKGSLTFAQFAKIFRGEITDWAEVGGTGGKIRFVDRPDFSDTRWALSRYKVFKAANFETGANATQVDRDDTSEVVTALGKDGISYAIASQVMGQDNVRVLPMHDTLPDNPQYPFSQPRGYVYKGTPNPGVQAFLGFATSEAGQDVIANAKKQESASVGTASPTTESTASTPPSDTPSDSTTGTTFGESGEKTGGGIPWWPWLLALPLAGGLLWWLLKDRGGTASVAAAPPGAAVPSVAAAPVEESRLILTPRNCREGYAYWEIPEEHKAERHRDEGRKLTLRLYDVSGIDMDRDIDRQTPQSVNQFDCNDQDQDLHIPIPVDNREYIAELGYLYPNGRWLKLARSAPVKVPACEPAGEGMKLPDIGAGIGIGIGTMGAAIAGGAAAVAGGAAAMASGAAASGTEAVADLGEKAKSMLDGERTALREPQEERTALREPQEERTALRETPQEQTLLRDPLQEQTVLRETPQDRIILVPRNGQEAYAYWEVSEAHKATLRQQGGENLTLRVYDAEHLENDHPFSTDLQSYECDEQAQDCHVVIPISDRSYVADLGYIARNGEWLRLARSLPVQVSSEP